MGLMIGFVVLLCWTLFMLFHVVFSSSAPVKILQYLYRDCFGCKFTFDRQIIFALAIPSIIVLIFFLTSMQIQVDDVQYYSRLVDHLEIMKKTSSVTHALQVERDAAVAYWMREGNGKKQDLKAAYEETNTARQSFLDKVTNMETELQDTEIYLNMVGVAANISDSRLVVWEVVSLSHVDEVYLIYDELISAHLEVYAELIRISRPDSFFYDLLAYTLYLPGKERAGAERAKGVKIWATQSWQEVGLDFYQGFAFYSFSQNVWLEMGKIYFTEEQFEHEESILDQSADVDRYLFWKDCLNSMNVTLLQVTNIDPVVWFNNCTTRIDLMLEAAQYLDEQLFQKTNQFAKQSESLFIICSTVIIASFVLSDNFTTLIMWRLVKLRELARNMVYKTYKKGGVSRKRRRKR